MRLSSEPAGSAILRGQAWRVILALMAGLLLFGGPGGVSAQMDLWGSVGLWAEHRRQDGASPQTATSLDSYLEWRLMADPWMVSLTVESKLQLTGDAEDGEPFSAGLTEGYLAYQARLGDLRVGRILMPLETARLTRPYTLTPDREGRRYGVDGARADLYLGASRLQMALVQVDEAWTPVVGLRHGFSGWEATVHVLARQNHLIGGLGGSGLVGSVVVYGEGWAVPGESQPRYVLGATGYAGDLIWTGEVGRVPLQPGVTPPEPLAAVQVAYTPTLGLILTASGAVTLQDEPASHYGLTATYELVPGESDVELAIRRITIPPAAPAWVVQAALRYYL